MGVDAEMFVKLRGRDNWLRPEDVTPTAYDMASTLGCENFLITVAEWPDHPTWEHHALSIVAPVKDAADAADRGLDASAIGRTVWIQDGPEVFAADDEQFVRVHLYTRYYGEDYARGNWPAIRSVAEWLAQRFPTGEIWYGGDSSGICAERLTDQRLDELNRFYLKSGRKTYVRYSDGERDRVTGQRAPSCPCCKVRMINSGGGRDVTFWYCDGCGKKAVTELSGIKFLKRHADYSDRANPEKIVA